ncbi:hypothetical protein [Anabaena sp. PCC 7108]|uniref:hypothetical protein n=1 Tax=Anabaena sp. PCC 7108 TaxID=163908 RepID=UPI0003481706|nr:hypothetical protein [Anabaena sp. PCC 7108]
MVLFQQSRQVLMAFVLMLVVTLTTACGGGTTTEANRVNTPTAIGKDVAYAELERGNTSGGQNFGNWVVQTSQGLVQDAYVRDNNKLGVIISPQVSPQNVKPLATSLVQGFRKNFPNQDLKVLIYAPDKKLILTADYDRQTNQVKYS